MMETRVEIDFIMRVCDLNLERTRREETFLRKDQPKPGWRTYMLGWGVE
jgi:hypothetical protein